MADSDSTGYIYVITNTVNGKQYVGQTTQPIELRWKQHLSASKNVSRTCRLLHHAIRKYGEQSFELHAMAVPINDLTLLEQRLIVAFGSLATNGYNLEAGGRGRGRLHPETKARISATLKARLPHPNSIAALRRPCSTETRAKLSAIFTGRVIDSAWRLNMRAAQLGKKQSEATRLKRSQALKGRKRPADVVARVRVGRWGR